MATKKPHLEAQAEATVQEQDLMAKLKVHKRRLIACSIVVAALCAAGLIWYFIAMNGARRADEAVALADTEINDSLALDYYQKAAKMGYKSGNRAGLNAAIILYRKGEYQQALDQLKDAGSSKSNIIEAGRYSLMGDCYANLGDLDKALSSFKDAYSAADNNPEIAPFILIKEANILREQGHFDDEYHCYKQIMDEYPNYMQQLAERRINLKKYAERAKAQSEK
ncbi:MAG: hypothetical protein LIP09_10430 [Bacteroidales bacterium]|nr:hypothetical protein [Bacteroidales bacterium]